MRIRKKRTESNNIKKKKSISNLLVTNVGDNCTKDLEDDDSMTSFIKEKMPSS